MDEDIEKKLFVKEMNSVIKWYSKSALNGKKIGDYNQLEKINMVLNGNRMQYIPYGVMRAHHILLLDYLGWQPTNEFHAELLLTHTIENVDEIWGSVFDKIDEFQDPIPVERLEDSEDVKDQD